jgi:phosphoglycerate dehydrogenase-like enzyme
VLTPNASTPLSVAISPLLLRRHRRQLEDVARGRVSWIEITHEAIETGRLSGADVAVTGRFPRDVTFPGVLASLTKVRWLHHLGAGLDRVLTGDLGAREIFLTNSAGAYAPAIAEYTLAAMVAMSRGFEQWHDSQRRHRWENKIGPVGCELFGNRVGIVGYGAIGRHLARAAKALGMEVWATKRTPMASTAEPLDRLLPAHDLIALLRGCRFIAITASLNSSTRNLIGAKELSCVKRGAILVNVARGPIVDRVALCEALRSGRVGGAMLDVTDPEPLNADDPLWDVPNLWISPHVSGETEDGYARAMDLFSSNLALFLDGNPERMGNLVDVNAHT